MVGYRAARTTQDEELRTREVEQQRAIIKFAPQGLPQSGFNNFLMHIDGVAPVSEQLKPLSASTTLIPGADVRRGKSAPAVYLAHLVIVV